MMKPARRRIAKERMQILIEIAASNARANPQLAQKQARIAWAISLKHRIRMPYHIRMTFCRQCKMFIAPGVDARFRIGRGCTKSVRITCGFCGHTYRKIIYKSRSD